MTTTSIADDQASSDWMDYALLHGESICDAPWACSIACQNKKQARQSVKTSQAIGPHVHM